MRKRRESTSSRMAALLDALLLGWVGCVVVGISKLPTAKFRAAPGGWGVHAKEKFLRRGRLRLSADALRIWVPKGMIFDRKNIQNNCI